MSISRLLVRLIGISCICVSVLASSRILNKQELGSVYQKHLENMMQIKVPGQAGASCAKHALFNGISIKNLMTRSGDALKQAYADIQDPAKRDEKFGPHGPWHNLIVQKRVKEKLRRQLEEQIALSLKGAQLLGPNPGTPIIYLKKLCNGKTVGFEKFEDSWDQGQVEALFQEITTISKKLVDDTFKKLVDDKFDANALSADISAADIRKALLARIQDRLSTIQNDVTFDLYLALHDEARLNEYFNFKDTVINSKADDKAEDSDWLFPGELEKIIATHKLDADTPIFHIAANINGADRLASDIELTDNKDFQKFMTDFQDPDGTATGIFLMYRTGGSCSAQANKSNVGYYAAATSENTNGHWYCMVANKVNGERQYVLADSLGNPCRLDHHRFRELKALLEGVPYVPVNPPTKTYSESRNNNQNTGGSGNDRQSFLSTQTLLIGSLLTALAASVIYYKYFANRHAFALRNRQIEDDAHPNAAAAAV